MQLQIEKMKLELAKQAAANEQLDKGLDQYSGFLEDIDQRITGDNQVLAADVNELAQLIDADRVLESSFFTFRYHSVTL